MSKWCSIVQIHPPFGQDSNKVCQIVVLVKIKWSKARMRKLVITPCVGRFLLCWVWGRRVFEDGFDVQRRPVGEQTATGRHRRRSERRQRRRQGRTRRGQRYASFFENLISWKWSVAATIERGFQCSFVTANGQRSCAQVVELSFGLLFGTQLSLIHCFRNYINTKCVTLGAEALGHRKNNWGKLWLFVENALFIYSDSWLHAIWNIKVFVSSSTHFKGHFLPFFSTHDS